MAIAHLYYFVAGFATLIGETFGSLFGGGSFVVQPALLAIGIEPRVAIANDVAACAFSSFFFVGAALNKQSLDFKIVAWMSPAIVFGAIIGGLALFQIPDRVETWVVVGVCCIGLLYNLFRIYKPASDENEHVDSFKHWQLPAIIVGTALGIYDGLSGAGSGILIIASLTMLFHKDMKATLILANFLSMISLASAGLTFWRLGLLDINLMIFMIPASCLAGILAARIVHIVSERGLRMTFVCVVGLLILSLATRFFH